MSRRKGVTAAELEVLEALHLGLLSLPISDTERRIRLYTETKRELGDGAARVAFMLTTANVPLNQITHIYSGVSEVRQNNNPGGQNVTQSAGGNMTGVNATGTQTIRDINVYSQDLDQSGAAVNLAARCALVEARDSIGKADIDAAMKPTIIEQFDKLTDELKKGDQKNPSVVGMLWNMVYGAVKAVPAAAAAVDSLDKLKGVLGL